LNFFCFSWKLVHAHVVLPLYNVGLQGSSSRHQGWVGGANTIEEYVDYDGREFYLCMLYDYPQLFYAYTHNFLWFVITVFMLLLDMLCNEIEVLIFRHRVYVLYILLEQISIYYCSTFLYIVGAAICVLPHNFIHCRSKILCMVRTLWHTLEQIYTPIHCSYAILYIVLCIVWVGAVLIPVQYSLEGMVFWDIWTVPLLIICP
jgi:hypothetical protein